MKFKVTEIFYSLQGEGLHLAPSIFIRLFGCNFKCAGFGMERGQLSTERDIIAENIDSYKTIEDIPLSRTGCDSFVAWDPRFKKFSNNYTSEEIIERIDSLISEVKTEDSTFLHIGKNKDIHIVITGGEPLLGWQKGYIELFDLINEKNQNKDWYVTFETNGTQKLHKTFIEYLNNHPNIKVTFSTSPKLSESGESWDDAIKPEVFETFKEVKNSITYSKFVIGKEEDFIEVDKAVKELDLIDFVYIMSVGGCYEEYIKLAPTIASLSLKKGYRYTPRLHVDLFGNAWGV